MPDEINGLCRFYAEQYGMIFHITYDPVYFTIKGHIIFRKVKNNFEIMCAGLSDKEISNLFHSFIYDVLAGNSLIMCGGDCCEKP